MSDDAPELNLRLQPSKANAGNHVQRLLPEISENLWMFLKHDQRFGARKLYKEKQFNDAVRYYFSATETLRNDWNEVNFDNLHRATSGFIESLKSLFPRDHTRMLTVLRRQMGPSISTFYKKSVELMRLLDLGFSGDDGAFESMQIPDQKSAPIYTKIEDSRLVLDAGRALQPLLRKEGIAETRAYLRDEITKLDEALRASNADPKYIGVFSHLKKLVDFQDDAGAISFGLHVRMVHQLTKNIEPEISEILAVQISSTLTHAAYFASQYKDWVEFIQNARNYPSREAVEGAIDAALEGVAADLSSRSEAVDERIPESIRLILPLLKGSKEDRMNAIYGGIRGIENICIATVKYAYDQVILLLQDAGKKARPTLVRIGAVAMVGVALAVISNFMPVIKSAPELHWIVENLSNIQKIDNLLK